MQPLEGEAPPEACAELARAPRILACLADDLDRAGLVSGNIPAAQLIFLACVSRLDKRPVSVMIKGPSSGGKSWLVETVLGFLPATAFYVLTAMSEKALVYSREPLAHRMIVLYEAAALSGDFGSYVLRSLLSEGKLRYEFVEKEKGQTRTIEREGPVGLISTTTARQLHPENETRFLSVPIEDAPDHVRQVLKRWGAAAEGGKAEPVDYVPWHALAHWLGAGARQVAIPFGDPLSERIPDRPPRILRDFIHLLSLIRAHALLHRATRERDEEGSILASLDDYEAVRALAEPLIAHGIEAAVKPQVREAVEAVGALAPGFPDGVPQRAVAERMRIDKGVASRRVREAKGAGYLHDEEQRPGRPSRLVIGEAMPTDAPVLPTSSELRTVIDGCTVDGVQEGKAGGAGR